MPLPNKAMQLTARGSYSTCALWPLAPPGHTLEAPDVERVIVAPTLKDWRQLIARSVGQPKGS
jgi:hypothetical protein